MIEWKRKDHARSVAKSTDGTLLYVVSKRRDGRWNYRAIKTQNCRVLCSGISYDEATARLDAVLQAQIERVS